MDNAKLLGTAFFIEHLRWVLHDKEMVGKKENLRWGEKVTRLTSKGGTVECLRKKGKCFF